MTGISEQKNFKTSLLFAILLLLDSKVWLRLRTGSGEIQNQPRVAEHLPETKVQFQIQFQPLLCSALCVANQEACATCVRASSRPHSVEEIRNYRKSHMGCGWKYMMYWKY